MTEKQLEQMIDALKGRQNTVFYKMFAIASVLSVAFSPIILWQLAEQKTIQREQFINNVAYESATQNVINRQIGRAEGRQEAMQLLEFRKQVAAEQQTIAEEMKRKGEY